MMAALVLTRFNGVPCAHIDFVCRPSINPKLDQVVARIPIAPADEALPIDLLVRLYVKEGVQPCISP